MWLIKRGLSRREPRHACKSLCSYFWYTVRSLFWAVLHVIAFALSRTIPFTPYVVSKEEVEEMPRQPLGTLLGYTLMGGMIAGVLVLAGWLLLIILSLILALFLGRDWLFIPLGDRLMQGVTLFGMCAVLAAALCWDDIASKVADCITKRTVKRNQGLVLSYLKAVKNRVCPFVTYDPAEWEQNESKPLTRGYEHI